MKVFALILNAQYERAPITPHAILSSYEKARRLLLRRDENAVFLSEIHGTCEIDEGWSGANRWQIREYELDAIPD